MSEIKAPAQQNITRSGALSRSKNAHTAGARELLAITNHPLTKLENPTLRLTDDQPTPCDIVRTNHRGIVIGYSPYDSGLLVGRKEEVMRKKDLRKLGEWLKQSKALKRK